MKNNFWKKAGWTGLTILPMTVSLVGQIAAGIVVMLAASVAVGFSAGLSGITDAQVLEEQIMEAVWGSMPIALLAYHIFALPVFGLWYYFGCGKPRPQKVGMVFTARTFFMTIFIGLLMCISANALLLAADYLVPSLIDQYEQLMETAGLGAAPLSIFVSVVIAPIGEELLCRGLIFHYAKKVVEGMKNPGAAFWISNSLQALMFGIMHGNLVQGSYAFLMGLCLGWLRQRYNSLYPSMLAHFVVNFASTFLAGALFGMIPEALPVYLAVTAAGIAIIVLLAVLEDRNHLRT